MAIKKLLNDPVYTPYIKFTIGTIDAPLQVFCTNDADTLISLSNDDNGVTSSFTIELAIVPTTISDLTRVDDAINETVVNHDCECHLKYGYWDVSEYRTANRWGIITGYTTDMNNGYLVYKIVGSTYEYSELRSTLLHTNIRESSTTSTVMPTSNTQGGTKEYYTVPTKTPDQWTTYKVNVGGSASRAIRRFYYYIVRVAKSDKLTADGSNAFIPYYTEQMIGLGSAKYPKGDDLSTTGIEISKYFTGNSNKVSSPDKLSSGDDTSNTYGGKGVSEGGICILDDFIFTSTFDYDHNKSIYDNLQSLLSMTVVPKSQEKSVKLGVIDESKAVALSSLIKIQFSTRNNKSEFRVVFYNTDYVSVHNLATIKEGGYLQYVFNWANYDDNPTEESHKVIKFTPAYDGAVLFTMRNRDTNQVIYKQFIESDSGAIKSVPSAYSGGDSSLSKYLTGTDVDNDMRRSIAGALNITRSYPYKAELKVIGVVKDFNILSSTVWVCPLIGGYPHFSAGFYRILSKKDDISGSGFTTTYQLLRVTDIRDKDNKIISQVFTHANTNKKYTTAPDGNITNIDNIDEYVEKVKVTKD